ncbi:MAG: DUF3536 domain-containing protein [Gemmatimonadaceae bacterium]
MQRDALRMFTSCAWFFDDIGGLEPRQVLRYAARAIHLAGQQGAALEQALLATLSTAVSNDRAVGTGRDVYLTYARQQTPAPARIAAAELAGRTIGVHHALEFAAASVVVERDKVTVTERRTGRVHTYAGRMAWVPARSTSSCTRRMPPPLHACSRFEIFPRARAWRFAPSSDDNCYRAA